MVTSVMVGSQESLGECTSLSTNTMKGYALTDSGNAERFAAQHGDSVRFCHPWKTWLVWDGKRWVKDEIAAVTQFAKQTVRAMYRETADLGDNARDKLAKHALSSEAAHRLAAMLRVAQSEPPIPITPDALDTDPWCLNVLDGTIDLRTGELRQHRREDLVTKMSPVCFDPHAVAPTWIRFLQRIFQGDDDVIQFVQRLCGYCLTGDVSEQILPILYGRGANGKTTLIETLMAMLGPDYSAKAPRDLLVAKRGNHHPTEWTVLHGRRLVAAVETEDGCRLAEAAVKEATGSDTITARRMYQDFWHFRPTHKIFLATNHKPRVTGTDLAIWRRLVLIPFDVTIPENERDPQLIEKLRGELTGILAWCVQGCLDWQEHGLHKPTVIRAATTQYRIDEDDLRSFVDDRCIRDANAKVPAKDVLAAYHDHVGDKSMSHRQFGIALTDMGFGSKKVNGRTWRTGIGLRTDHVAEG